LLAISVARVRAISSSVIALRSTAARLICLTIIAMPMVDVVSKEVVSTQALPYRQHRRAVAIFTEY